MTLEGLTGNNGAGRWVGTLLAAVGVAAIAAYVGQAAPGARSGFAPSQTLDVEESVDALAANGSRAAFLWDGYSVLLHKPVFDLEGWNTLEMAYIPRHDRILPDQGGRANEYIFHANQLATTC